MNPRRVTLTCTEHGRLHAARVYAWSEVDQVTELVRHAHWSSYEAGCGCAVQQLVTLADGSETVTVYMQGRTA